jgi:hypothetical protein
MLRSVSVLAIGIGMVLANGNHARAQVAVSIGEAPVCPYGYYEAPPYNCAPDGYYGPEWFSGGIFIGAGPWYHGPDHFYGHVDHHLDYRKGYHRRGGSARRNIGRNFMVRRCMMFTVMRRRAAISNGPTACLIFASL